MRNIIISLICISLYGCNASLNSVTNRSKLDKKYENIIFVINKTKQTKILTGKIETELDLQFKKESDSFTIKIFENKNYQLRLNNDLNEESKVLLEELENGSHDLVLYFIPLKTYYNNNMLQKISYKIVGFDINKKQEVWKGILFMNGGMTGPINRVEISIKKLIEKLKLDNII